MLETTQIVRLISEVLFCSGQCCKSSQSQMHTNRYLMYKKYLSLHLNSTLSTWPILYNYSHMCSRSDLLLIPCDCELCPLFLIMLPASNHLTKEVQPVAVALTKHHIGHFLTSTTKNRGELQNRCRAR